MRTAGLGTRARGAQRGAVSIVVGATLVVLLLVLGFVVDLGHLYIVKSELQNAADACALAAAREFADRSEGVIARATATGLATGNLHRVDFQSQPRSAGDPPLLAEEDVTFSATLHPASPETYRRSFAASELDALRYVRCTPGVANVRSVALLFMPVAALLPSGGELWKWDMSALATAKLVSGQGPCAIPLAICTNTPTASVPYGFVTGTWYFGHPAEKTFGWVRFPGTPKSAKELLAGPGRCSVPETTVSKEGHVEGLDAAWNTRFGVYTAGYDVDTAVPDGTGYPYTPTISVVDSKGATTTYAGNWPNTEPQNAYPDYQHKANVTHAPFDPSQPFYDSHGKQVKIQGTPISQAQHAEKGRSRRMVITPVVSCADLADPGRSVLPVLDWACSLMLTPIGGPKDEVGLEYRGLRSQACAGFGVPGGENTPVPALVE
jgi:hypothetical protein